MKRITNNENSHELESCLFESLLLRRFCSHWFMCLLADSSAGSNKNSFYETWSDDIRLDINEYKKEVLSLGGGLHSS